MWAPYSTTVMRGPERIEETSSVWGSSRSSAITVRALGCYTSVDKEKIGAARRASRQRALKITSLLNSARRFLPDVVCFRHSPLGPLSSVDGSHPRKGSWIVSCLFLAFYTEMMAYRDAPVT